MRTDGQTHEDANGRFALYSNAPKKKKKALLHHETPESV